MTFGNGLRMSLRAAARLRADGIGCRVVDLRWIAPLPVADMLREAAATARVLVADETRHTGGVSEGVITALADAGFAGRVARVASEDSFVPLGDAAATVLLSQRSSRWPHASWSSELAAAVAGGDPRLGVVRMAHMGPSIVHVGKSRDGDLLGNRSQRSRPDPQS